MHIITENSEMTHKAEIEKNIGNIEKQIQANTLIIINKGIVHKLRFLPS